MQEFTEQTLLIVESSFARYCAIQAITIFPVLQYVHYNNNNIINMSACISNINVVL